MDHTVVIIILTMLPARHLDETCASGQGSMLLLELFLQVQDGDGDFLTSLWPDIPMSTSQPAPQCSLCGTKRPAAN